MKMTRILAGTAAAIFAVSGIGSVLASTHRPAAVTPVQLDGDPAPDNGPVLVEDQPAARIDEHDYDGLVAVDDEPDAPTPDAPTGDGDATAGDDGTAGGDNTGDGDATKGDDGTSGGNNTGDGDSTRGDDGTGGGDNTKDDDTGGGGDTGDDDTGDDDPDD